MPSLTNNKNNIEESINQQIITQTERLIIREFQVLDIEALAQILAKPEVMQFSLDGVLSSKQTAVKIQSFLDSYQKYGLWKIRSNSSSKWTFNWLLRDCG